MGLYGIRLENILKVSMYLFILVHYVNSLQAMLQHSTPIRQGEID